MRMLLLSKQEVEEMSTSNLIMDGSPYSLPSELNLPLPLCVADCITQLIVSHGQQPADNCVGNGNVSMDRDDTLGESIKNP